MGSNSGLTIEGASGDLNVYEIRRALDTGDIGEDYVFALDTEFDMIWAMFTDTSGSASH